MCGSAELGNRIAERFGVVAVLLLALLVRAAIPAGWMPNTTGDAPLIICTGHGPSVLGEGGPRPVPGEPHHSGRHDHCVFSGAGVAPLPEALLAPEPPAYAPAPRPQPRVNTAPAASRLHREQSARGPPTSI